MTQSLVAHDRALAMGLLALMLLMAGCSPRIDLSMAASPDINPAPSGDPLSVVVRVYQLEDADAFLDAGFDDLLVDDEAALGSTLLVRDEYVVLPDELKTVTVAMEQDAAYVAVTVLYRRPGNSNWRVIEELPGGVLGLRGSSRLKLGLSGSALLVGDEAESVHLLFVDGDDPVSDASRGRPRGRR